MTPENKLRILLEEQGRGSKTRLAEFLGVPRNYVSRWSKGTSRYKIPKELLPKIAAFFNVPIDYFFSDDTKVGIKLIPLIGRASCGVPNGYFYEASEHIPVPADMSGNLYAVEAEGDSMSPKINNGDIVICNLDKEVQSGDIVHYTIDGESGIKKIKFTDEGILLTPLNPDYDPIFYPKERLDSLPHRFVKCEKVITSL